MNFIQRIFAAIKRERNRRRRWAYRNRIHYTWRDPRSFQSEFESWQRRMRQS